MRYKNHEFATHISFSSQNTSNLLPSAFPRVHLKNPQHISPSCPLKFSKETIILLEVPKSLSLAISSYTVKRNFSASGLQLCGPCAHIIPITSLPAVRTIAITLSLFPPLSRFQPIPILCHFLTTIVYTFVPKYPQNKFLGLSILLPACSSHQLFFRSLHIAVFLPQKLSTFKISNHIPRHLGSSQ